VRHRTLAVQSWQRDSSLVAKSELFWANPVRFLAKPLALADWTARPDADNEQHASAFERAVGFGLPAAFRELVVSDAWPGFLKRFSNSDQPVLIQNFAASRWQAYDPIAADLLPFMIENQGVCTWAIRLNGNDDPEVLVEVDSGTPPQWQRCAEAFSQWLECQVRDALLSDRMLFAAQAAPLEDLTLDHLTLKFAEGPRTYGWPGRVNYRFHGTLGDLLLWAADDQCDWWIAPSSLGCALELLQALPIRNGHPGWIYELKPEGKPLLERWRGGAA
jgi:hypothetical protein